MLVVINAPATPRSPQQWPIQVVSYLRRNAFGDKLGESEFYVRDDSIFLFAWLQFWQASPTPVAPTKDLKSRPVLT
jgi:hypothetical protein